MLATLDWIIIGAFILLSLAISLFFRERAGQSLQDFFLGGRNLPWYIAGTSMVATTFAADTPLAVTELVAQNGISGNWLWWSFLFGGMLTTFFFANLWRRANVLTEVELIEIRYSGKAAGFLRGFRALYLGLFMNVLIIGWVNVALMSIFQIFFNIPPEETLQYAAIAMLIAAVYSSISGLWGVAVTDVVQFIIAMIGTITLAIFVVNTEEVGGIAGLKEKLPAWSLDFFPTIGGSVAGSAKALTISLGAFLAYTTVQWWASWYPGAEPGGGGYVAQRMMSAKNEKHAVYATLFFQVAHYCIRPWPWILVGLSTLVLYPDLAEADKKLGYVMAMKDYLPVGVKGLLLVAFLAAYMSTISTQLNWGASYLVNDLYKRFANPNASQKSLVASSRLVTLGLAAVGLFATQFMDSISGVWSFIIECGAGLGLVLILRWYWWRINAWSEISATLAPFVGFAISRYAFGLQFPDSFFMTVGFTTVTWLVVTFVTRPTDEATLKSFYSLVRPDGVWGPVRSLVDGTSAYTSNIGNLLVCWFSGVTFTYSALFFTGKVIFQEWALAGVWGVVCLASLLVLRYFMGRTNILN